MRAFIMLLVIFATITSVTADAATQTDWSGGEGVTGPVSDWGNSFDVSSEIDWALHPDSLLLSADSTIVKHAVVGNFFSVRSVYAADVDADGDMDVLGTSYSADDITWWENTDGTGTSWTEHTVDNSFDGAVYVYAADVDADGDMDVLGAARAADDIAWWENTDGTGTSWTEHTVDGDFDHASSVYAADVDGDGDMDVLGTAPGADDISWWENTDGTGTSWAEHTVNSDFNGAYCVYAADIDGDGDMDVLGAACYANDILRWENTDGTGTSLAEHTVDGDFDGAWSVYTADVDGDGDMDVLGAARNTDDITWWENTDGTGTSWAEHTVDGDFDEACSVYSADVDGDGDMDVLGAARYANDITWWENADGTGTSWAEHTVDDNFFDARSVYAVDVSGDGNLDILGAAQDGNKIAWWNLHAFAELGTLESSILQLNFTPGDSISWGTVTWLCEEPDSTGLAFLVRSSDDATNMGEWSDTIAVSGTSLNGILGAEEKFIQYKAILGTNNIEVSPTLFEVTINYDVLGISEETEPNIRLLPVSPNPSAGAAVITFELPEAASVDISVFDMSGRLIREVHGDDYTGGAHGIMLGQLPPGSYLCRMTSGDFEDSQRFVVLK